MSVIGEIVDKIYTTFESLEQDVHRAAGRDGFVVCKKNIDCSKDVANKILKGKLSLSQKWQIQSTSKRGTAKTECPFRLNFRWGATDMTYHFTENCELTHNHPINPSSTTMTAMVRRFTPKQRDIVESMHANRSPASQVVAELRKTTDVIIRKKDVYNAFQRVGRAHVGGAFDVQELLQILDGHPGFTYVVKVDERNQLKGFTFACLDSLAQFRK